jgi:2-succinyl-5-enolpyruvyl-6-hydroxy-3-cyclohexene-1-carboxylate synthase
LDSVRHSVARDNLAASLTLLQRLWSGGVAALVLCPGSRSAPLAVAAGLLARRGLALHTAIDERSAAFFALGLVRAGGRPVAVITTSGSAVANLLPAAVEADLSVLPLLLLSADRPERLKRCGANQTVDQEAFLLPAVRWFGGAAPQGLGAMTGPAVIDLAERALAALAGSSGDRRAPGPVHLNLPFEEPLHADAATIRAVAAQLPEPSGGLASPPAWPPDPPEPSPPCPVWPDGGGLDPDRPGVVLAGPWRGLPQHWPGFVAALQGWLARTGWPLLADGLSGLRGLAALQPLAGYDLLLADPVALPAPADLQVLRLGPLPASRRLQQWLAALGGRQLLISEADPRRLDPLGRVSQQWPAGLEAWWRELPPRLSQGVPAPASLALRRRWRERDQALQRWLDRQLAPPSWGEPAVARRLSRLLPEGVPLLLANSSPVRDWESFAVADGPARPVYGFRGASGIDGTLSQAFGIAAAAGAAVLLSGDLALLHDSNGWLWASQRVGRLTVVLLDNGGGGIFEQLPIRSDPDAVLDFERLFAMGQPLDQTRLAAAHGVPSRQLASASDLPDALAWSLEQPLALLRLRTDRRADAALRQALRRMAASTPAPG